MQNRLSFSTAPTTLKEQAAQGLEATHAPSASSPLAVHRASLLQLWQATTAACVAHAAPTLLLGVIGVVIVPLISPALALLALPITRTAITQMVFYERLGTRWLRQMPALLIVAWVYAGIIAAAQIGVAVPLRAWGINLNLVEQKSTTWEAAAQTLMLRSIDAISLMPDSSFRGWLPSWCNWGFDEWVRKPNDAYEYQLMVDYQHSGIDLLAGAGVSGIEAQATSHQLKRPALWLMFVVGIVMLLVSETLFAFRSLTNAKPTRLFWLSLKHFGTVAGHLWCLRLVIVGLKALLVFMPIVVVDRYSYLAHDWGWFGSPLQATVLTICLALISAFGSVFEAVYAARLFLALSESC